MNLDEMRGRLDVVMAEMRQIHEAAGDAPFTPEQTTRWGELEAEHTNLEAQIAERARREALISRSAAVSGTPGEDRRGPEVIIRKDPFEVLDSRGAGMSQTELRRTLVDANLRAIDGRIEDGDNQAHYERILKRHAADTRWAANLLGRSRPEYETGWAKLMMGRGELLTSEERAAMAVSTNTAGGYMVPTHLDPTIILTNSGTSNAIRGISRVVTLSEGSTWNGVTAAGVTASWDGELVEVSDDTPAVARASVTAYQAQALVQASFASIEDIANLTTDVLMMLADARDRLEGAAHATGSGSSQPTGIFTALDANTNVEIISTTAATIGLVDIHSVYRQVPVRWRGKSTWVMNPLYSLAIKQLGTALSASYSTDLTQAMAGSMLGRPLVESDDAPTVQTTTANDNEIVFGDFSNFVIVDKPGSMAVEFIPQMFATANNLPDGRRAWLAHWRNGSDSVNDLAFRLLQDKTSA